MVCMIHLRERHFYVILAIRSEMIDCKRYWIKKKLLIKVCVCGIQVTIDV